MAIEDKLDAAVKEARSKFGAKNVPDWLVSLCLKISHEVASKHVKLDDKKKFSESQAAEIIKRSGAIRIALQMIKSSSPEPKFTKAAEVALNSSPEKLEASSRIA